MATDFNAAAAPDSPGTDEGTEDIFVGGLVVVGTMMSCNN